MFPVSFIQALISLPPPFPTGFLLLAKQISTRILFHRQSVISGFVSHLKAGYNRMSLRILFLQVFAPFFIVKWFRHNQWTWAESHLTFYMFFPSCCYQFYILILPCLVCIVNHRPALDAWKLLDFLKNIIITFPTPELQWILVHVDFWADIKLSVQYVTHLMALISEIESLVPGIMVSVQYSHRTPWKNSFLTSKPNETSTVSTPIFRCMLCSAIFFNIRLTQMFQQQTLVSLW